MILGTADGNGSSSRTNRVVAATVVGLKSYVRNPLLLAMFAFLPAYFLGVVSFLTPSAPMPVHLPGGGTTTASLSTVYPVLLTPLVGALVGGFAGFFRTHAGRDADARLVLAGYRPAELITARLGLLAVVGILVTGVSMGVLLVTLGPNRPAAIALATLFAATTYGIVGALVGTAVGRLPGVYLMLFGPSLDVFLFQNPASTLDRPVELLPGHYPAALALEAQFGGGITVETLGLAVAYLAVVTVVSVAFARIRR
ncbi:hypothetical protein V5735_02390 (plasmid) [Haladaptatus sp. SPP-AMP-3]|uniref:hypothetical protein n=1 Tax=Haladaptatus sp. SPP-AMP-3 TaxID=3121295 RepID=UPI003C2BBF62